MFGDHLVGVWSFVCDHLKLVIAKIPPLHAYPLLQNHAEAIG